MSANSTIGQYSYNELKSSGGELSRNGVRFGSKASLLLGALMAIITAASVTEVQTLAYTGSGTTGTFQLQFDGNTTAALPFNATAAQVQAALRALPNVQNGFTCTGGALGTASVVITASAQLANLDLPLITVVNNGTDFSTLTVTETTKGRGYGTAVPWDGSRIADPATAVVTPSGTGSGGTWVAGTYSVQATWSNAQGETLPGLVSTVALTSAQQLRIAAINAANTPDDATALNIYVNGAHVAAISVTTPGTGGNVVQTDLAGPAGTGRALPRENTAFVWGDGRQICRGFAPYALTTDVGGNLIYGQSPLGSAMGNLRDGHIVVGGLLSLAAVPTLNALALSQLGGRFIKGGFGDLTSLVLIPGYGGF